MKTMKTAKWGYIITSVIFCITGLLIVACPGISVSLFCYILGALLAVSGIIKIIGYFSRDLYMLAFQFDLALGILLCILGLVMILYPEVVLHVIFFLIGITVLTDSLFKVQTAYDAKKFGLRQWWIILISALLTCIFGILIIIDPFGGAKLTMVIAGITLILEGFLNLCVAVYAVKIIKSKKPDIVMTDHTGL